MIPSLLFIFLIQAATPLAASTTCNPADGRVCPAPPNTKIGPLLLKVKVPDRLDDPNALSVKTTLINTGDTTITILRDPNSPLSRDKTHSFDFYKVPKVGARPPIESCPDAAPVDGVVWYESDLYEMATRSDKDAYIVLEPKQSTTSVSNLSQMYMFPEPAPYVVRVTKSARHFVVIADNGSPAFVQAKVADDSDALKAATVTVSKQAIDPRPNAAQGKTGKDPLADWEPQPSFHKCTAAQQRVIKTAIKMANKTLDEVDNFLAAPDSLRSSRFTDWFGPASEAQWLLVRANYLTIEANPAHYRYDCSCKKCDKAAFTSLSTRKKTPTINVCKSFWWAPRTGEDSKVGVLIREASRFEFFTNPQDGLPKAASVKNEGTKTSSLADYDPGAYQVFAEQAEISLDSWGVRSLTSCFSNLCSGRRGGSWRRRRRPKYRHGNQGTPPPQWRGGVQMTNTLVQDPNPDQRRPPIGCSKYAGPGRGPQRARFPGQVSPPTSPRPVEGLPAVGPSQDGGLNGNLPQGGDPTMGGITDSDLVEPGVDGSHTPSAAETDALFDELISEIETCFELLSSILATRGGSPHPRGSSFP